ncbi:MAG TPA: hypothetical protein PLL62_06435 [Candidatus Saccharicenans sp.]|nr:hypothetical protein [Candidatus Saccharicenans sp.]HQM74855.1 hypothetical protein [Candidatus Saccharicenans sp.]
MKIAFFSGLHGDWAALPLILKIKATIIGESWETGAGPDGQGD